MSFYDLLGVSKDASENDIKKAYKKVASTNHPDKGGDQEKFKEIQKAYETLSDPNKRRIYDQMGEEGLNQAGSSTEPEHDPFDMFAQMFGGSPFRRNKQQQRSRKGDTVKRPLEVELDEMYLGNARHLKIKRNIICTSCSGNGTQDGQKPPMCKQCQGNGFQKHVQQLGPGMMTQTIRECQYCKGKGVFVNTSSQCNLCEGIKTIPSEETLQVYIEPGSKHGTTIPFEGKADEVPGGIAGDLVIVLQQRTHSTFKRQGDNLIYNRTLSLRDALEGFSFSIDHMDGRKICVKSNNDYAYKDGTVMKIPCEGMPKSNNQYGNLYIHFNIDMPSPNYVKSYEDPWQAFGEGHHLSNDSEYVCLQKC